MKNQYIIHNMMTDVYFKEKMSYGLTFTDIENAQKYTSKAEALKMLKLISTKMKNWEVLSVRT